MKNIPAELKEYVEIYYNFNNKYNIPDNINIYILDEKQFLQKISQKMTEVFRIKSPNVEEGINGLVIVDSKNKYKYTYNVYLLKEQEDIYPYMVSVLFHELSHVHTLPNIEIFDLKTYDEAEHFSYKGYTFWKEFIANYIGDNTFYSTYGEIGYITDKEKLIKLFNSCFKNNEMINSVDELISFILLSNHDIKKEIKDAFTYDKYLAFVDLLNICNKLLQLEDLTTISKEELHEIGKLLNILEIKNTKMEPENAKRTLLEMCTFAKKYFEKNKDSYEAYDSTKCSIQKYKYNIEDLTISIPDDCPCEKIIRQIMADLRFGRNLDLDYDQTAASYDDYFLGEFSNIMRKHNPELRTIDLETSAIEFDLYQKICKRHNLIY